MNLIFHFHILIKFRIKIAKAILKQILIIFHIYYNNLFKFRIKFTKVNLKLNINNV